MSWFLLKAWFTHENRISYFLHTGSSQSYPFKAHLPCIALRDRPAKKALSFLIISVQNLRWLDVTSLRECIMEGSSTRHLFTSYKTWWSGSPATRQTSKEFLFIHHQKAGITKLAIAIGMYNLLPALLYVHWPLLFNQHRILHHTPTKPKVMGVISLMLSGLLRKSIRPDIFVMSSSLVLQSLLLSYGNWDCWDTHKIDCKHKLGHKLTNFQLFAWLHGGLLILPQTQSHRLFFEVPVCSPWNCEDQLGLAILQEVWLQRLRMHRSCDISEAHTQW